MTTPPIYLMSAHENVAEANINSPATHQDTYQRSPGSTFDFVRRIILYSASVYDGTPVPNDTGNYLWSGQNLIAPGADIVKIRQQNLHVCTKDLDSEDVTWNDCYGSSRTVPGGIQLKIAGAKVAGSGYVNGTYLGVPLTGGSGTGAFANVTVIGGAVAYVDYIYNPSGGYAVNDVLTASNAYLGGSGSGFTFTITSIARTATGAERRFVESQDKAFPQLVDPRTGDTWLHVDSSAGTYICTTYLFRNSDDFQQVISPLLPAHPNAHMEPIGISDAWAYVIETTGTEASNYHISLTPRILTATEEAVDFLLTYANYDFPTLFNGMAGSGPNAFVFTDDQTVYFLYMGLGTGSSSVSRGYKLYRFDEPTSAPHGGPVVGGGFTDVTPWAAGTGPNTNAASYTYNKSTGQSGWNYPTNNFLYHLRDTNQIAIVSKFFSWQTSNTLTVDPALTFFDLTYFDVAGGTFDYHHAFVTGYMDADWNPTDASGAAWIVIDATQINQFVGQNTYTFVGHDYTKAWFSFVVQPYDAGFAGPDQSLWHTILVEYQLAYGSAPAVTTIYDEVNWDTKYAAYGAEIGNANVVWNSQGIYNQDEISNSGIYDATDNAFWWGGDTTLRDLNLTLFNDLPFLKLNFGRADHPNILLWTFEMDGHEYLVAPLQEETLVYDFLMEQWYVWGNGETPIWAAQHGQNWNANLGTVMSTLGGDRVSNVICGDRLTGALYFLDPELNEDYSNTGVSGQPFQRVITGQLLSRTSNYAPLAQVEVTCSDGEAVVASNMTVDLQYSDDRGYTYNSFGARTVVPDEFGIQCQWRSLGGYRTPGRLLKLIDYGALTRVDDWTVPDDG